MKRLTLSRLSCLVILVTFGILLFQSCDHDSFGKDMEVQILPTNLSYSDIIGAREFGYIETSTPTYNSNGHPVLFEVVSIKKDDAVLDASYLSSISILNPIFYEVEIEDTGQKRIVDDLSKAGKIIIEDDNPFANGNYYFTIKATVIVNNTPESVVFEDALHLQVGPELAVGLSFCPFKFNFVSGQSAESVAPEVFGGNPDIRYELGTESEKLSINPTTGVLSANSSYTVSATEYLNPVINVVSNISEEVVSFENTITVALSTTPVVFDLVKDYFFYPPLKPSFANNTAAGSNNYSVELSDFVSKPNWVKKHFYKETPGAQQLKFQEVLDTRIEAGVSGVKGLAFYYWGPLKNPFESWVVANPVNLSSYAGCFNTKVVFWVKQNIPQNTLDNVFPGQTETPVNIEIQITDNYSGDVTTTDWTQINDQLTCKIGEADDTFLGTPYPLSGDVDPAKNANNSWVKCEMDLAEYGDVSSFTIAFRTKTNYDSDLSDNLRGELFISDLHFVASEKQ